MKATPAQTAAFMLRHRRHLVDVTLAETIIAETTWTVQDQDRLMRLRALEEKSVFEQLVGEEARLVVEDLPKLRQKRQETLK